MPQPKFNFHKNNMPDVNTNTIKSTGTDTPIESTHEDIPFKLQYVPRDKIQINPKNSYPQEDIEKLAQSILNFGLLHNLEGFYDEDKNIYILESGERRTRAIDFLIEKYKDYTEKENDSYQLYLKNVHGFIHGYPMNIKLKLSSENMTPLEAIESELRLMAANEETRNTTPEKRLQNIAKYSELYSKRNALLKKPINVNEEIAKQENISARQVQKYKNVLKLIPELQEAFNNSNITLNEGSSYASLSEEDQLTIVHLLQAGQKVSKEELDKLKHAALEKDQELQMLQRKLEETQMQKAEIESSNLVALEKIKAEYSEKSEQLKEEIRLELELNNPDKEKIADLEKAIAEAESKGKEKIIEEQKKSQTVEKKLAEVTEQMEKLQKQLKEETQIPKENLEIVKLEINLENAISQMEQALKKLTTCYRAFRNTEGEISPYTEKIKAIILNLEKCK